MNLTARLNGLNPSDCPYIRPCDLWLELFEVQKSKSEDVEAEGMLA